MCFTGSELDAQTPCPDVPLGKAADDFAVELVRYGNAFESQREDVSFLDADKLGKARVSVDNHIRLVTSDIKAELRYVVGYSRFHTESVVGVGSCHRPGNFSGCEDPLVVHVGGVKRTACSVDVVAAALGDFQRIGAGSQSVNAVSLSGELAACNDFILGYAGYRIG